MAGGQPILATIEKRTSPDIVRLNDGTIQAYDFTLTACGIFPDGVPQDIEKWNFLRDLLFSIEGRIGLFIGDYLVGMEKIYGQTYSELAEEVGREPSTLYNYHWVCRNVDFSLRKENLSFGHYNLVAGKDPEEQEQWLNMASAGDVDEEGKVWSVARLRAEMKALESELIDNKPEKFDRNLMSIQSELTEKNWKKWDKKTRRQRYELFKNLLVQMEEWGL